MGTFAKQQGREVADLRPTTAMVALQGPTAPGVFEEVIGTTPRRFHNSTVDWESETVFMGGTGYTGEAGGEICASPATGQRLVRTLVEAGITPCGLGARDTLRLEARLPLWGEDIDESPTTQTGIGLGYLSPPPRSPGSPVEVELRGRWLPGRVATSPLHQP